jgi:hypothetical protein
MSQTNDSFTFSIPKDNHPPIGGRVFLPNDRRPRLRLQLIHLNQSHKTKWGLLDLMSGFIVAANVYLGIKLYLATIITS